MLGLSSKSATVALLLLFLGVVHAVPLATEKRTFDTSVRVPRDEDNISQPTTVQTTNVIQTAVGPMVQTCTIKLEPITGDDGKPLVRETKSCSISMPSNGNNASGSNGNSSGSSDSGSNSSSSDSASATQASSSADSSKATQTEASASATEGSASATATASGANGSSEVPGSALSTGATDSGAATATGSSGSAQASPTATAGSGAGAVSAGGFSTIDKSAVATETGASASASPTASGTASASATPAPSGTGTAVGDAAGSPSSASSAADTAESSPAASFQLPGTKLQVLPIGLGVFAGISVIALIVVGLVTYERTKYRKAFRQRKLAESGAAMGYGGMAQAA